MIQFLWTQSFILQSRRFAREISKNLRLLLLRIQFATSRSSTSHPTLLQCVALPGKDKPNNLEMARVLIEAGAELNQPLVATASIDYRAVAEVCSIMARRLTAPVVGRQLKKLSTGTAGMCWLFCLNVELRCKTCGSPPGWAALI